MEDSIYSYRPNLMIGFHGCSEKVRNDLVSYPNNIKTSTSSHDWLGHGFYIWENNYVKALQWAEDKKRRDKDKDFVPSVVGVVFTLGLCLDFSDSEYTGIIKNYYELFKQDCEAFGNPLPHNKDVKNDEYHDLLLRELDCAVIQFMHSKITQKIKEETLSKGYSEFQQFDTVRGLFTEGGPAYEGAGIQTKNHIQICVRNMNCIKGFFIPRKKEIKGII